MKKHLESLQDMSENLQFGSHSSSQVICLLNGADSVLHRVSKYSKPITPTATSAKTHFQGRLQRMERDIMET